MARPNHTPKSTPPSSSLHRLDTIASLALIKPHFCTFFAPHPHPPHIPHLQTTSHHRSPYTCTYNSRLCILHCPFPRMFIMLRNAPENAFYAPAINTHINTTTLTTSVNTTPAPFFVAYTYFIVIRNYSYCPNRLFKSRPNNTPYLPPPLTQVLLVLYNTQPYISST